MVGRVGKQKTTRIESRTVLALLRRTAAHLDHAYRWYYYFESEVGFIYTDHRDTDIFAVRMCLSPARLPPASGAPACPALKPNSNGDIGGLHTPRRALFLWNKISVSVQRRVQRLSH